MLSILRKHAIERQNIEKEREQMGEEYIFHEKDPYFKEHAAERFLSQIQVKGDGEKLGEFCCNFLRMKQTIWA